MFTLSSPPGYLVSTPDLDGDRSALTDVCQQHGISQARNTVATLGYDRIMLVRHPARSCGMILSRLVPLMVECDHINYFPPPSSLSYVSGSSQVPSYPVLPI